jgi:hypothetical protein
MNRKFGNLASNYQIYEARKSVLQIYADHQALVNISHEDRISIHNACLIDVWG